MIAYLLILHFVADFLLQSREMGKKKSSDIYWLKCHLLIQYGIFLFGLLLVVGIAKAFIFALLNAAIHGIIDWNIWRAYKFYAYKEIDKNPSHPLLTGDISNPWKYWEDHWFYTTIGADQLLHGLTLVFLAWFIL